MTTYPVIQRYDGTAGFNIATWELVVDGSNGRFFAFDNGNRDNKSAGVYRFDIASGSQTGFLAASTMFASDLNNAANIRAPMALTFGGSIVLCPLGNPDFSVGYYALVNGTTMAVSARLGIGGVGLTTNVPSVAAGNMTPLTAGGIDFVLLSTGGQSPTLSVIEAHGATLQFAGHQFSTDEQNGSSGSTTSTAGIAYSAYYTNTGAGKIGIYKTTLTASAAGYNTALWPGTPNSHITTTKIGVVLAASIDSGWGTGRITTTGTPMYDAYDGHVVLLVSGPGGGTHSTYLVKVSTVDASIVWKLGLDGVGYITASNANLNGTLWIVYGSGAGDTIYQIDTTAGTLTSSTAFSSANGLVDALPMYDATTASVFTNNTFGGTSTPPPYPASGTAPNPGIVEWTRYITGSAPTPPVPPYVPSRQRAWTYTMDGHTFYVLDLGTEGTFAYDVVTDQWSKFDTAGFLQWDMASGVQWGQRVVGGDLQTGQVWELAPSKLRDNDASDITHTVTGGVTTRTRAYESVAALRLTFSAGELQNTLSGSVINMRWSDDAGQTFTAYFTIPVVEGDTTGEVLFRSLGAFKAPGRIFEINDVGGPLRIDGCDAMIGSFDDEKQPAEQP